MIPTVQRVEVIGSRYTIRELGPEGFTIGVKSRVQDENESKCGRCWAEPGDEHHHVVARGSALHHPLKHSYFNDEFLGKRCHDVVTAKGNTDPETEKQLLDLPARYLEFLEAVLEGADKYGLRAEELPTRRGMRALFAGLSSAGLLCYNNRSGGRTE